MPVGLDASATITILAPNASATWRTRPRRNASPTAPAVPSATAHSRSWPRSRAGLEVVDTSPIVPPLTGHAAPAALMGCPPRDDAVATPAPRPHRGTRA